MMYRTFPKIPGLQVSVLGFGCMRLPVLGGDMARIVEEPARALLRWRTRRDPDQWPLT